MAAGLRSQGIAPTRVALAPIALAGLMGVALLLGGVLGVVTKSELDSITGTQASARITASDFASRLLAERARITVGRGPLVRDPGAGGSLPQAAVHASDHIGLTERRFPVSTPHRVEHGPLP